MFTTSEALEATKAWLRQGKPHADFEQEHGISVKSDGKHLILDYHITVNWAEPYGYVCRGLVLDAETLDVLCLGLKKFFNDGEGYADPIDWDSSRVYEKIDGTMVARWFSPKENKFVCTTRFQLPDSIHVNLTNTGIITWEKMFERCFEGIDLSAQPKNETWVFEACSPHNMIVVQHASFHAKLLAIRNNVTLEERPVETVGLPIPKSYKFSNATDVAAFANQHSGTVLEGFVVVDSNYNRIKIKSDEYVRLHRLASGLNSAESVLLIVRGNDYEEILTHFPQYKEPFERVATLINDSIELHTAAYEELAGLPTQKDFALAVQKKNLPFSDVLYKMRAGRELSVKHAFSNMKESVFVNVLKPFVKEILEKK